MLQGDERVEFAGTVEAPRLARAAIARFAGTHGVDEARTDIARLLGSELVTNALLDEGRPAGRGIHMHLAATAGTLWIAVSNGGRTPPPQALDGLVAGDGVAMELVETTSSRWGVHADGQTHVWCELDPAEATEPAPARLTDAQWRELAIVRVENLDHGIAVRVEALTGSRRLVVGLEAGRLRQLLAIAPDGEREDDVYIKDRLRRIAHG